MSICGYTRAKCARARHVTKGGNVHKFCTFHVMKTTALSKRVTKVLSHEESIAVREKARLKMVLHRARKKKVLEDIVDPEVQIIATQMSKLKERQLGFIIIDKVIENLDPNTIKLMGFSEPIDFTDSKAPVLRTMQEVDTPSDYIANVLKAIDIVFPGCQNQCVKMIKSLPNDLPQLTHTDFDVSLINNRVSTLSAFHYSVIITLQDETHLLIGTERVRQNIPVNSMIMFRGDLPHAGGGYAADNSRIFISVSSEFYPQSSSVFFVN